MGSRDTLDGETALVTGASGGIGRATAIALGSKGASVGIAARREQELESVANTIRDRYGSDVLVTPTDLRDRDAVIGMVEATVDRFGGLDILVNNAAVGHEKYAPIEELSMEAYDAIRDVNMDAVYLGTRAAIPHLRSAEGHLVFIGSIGGQYPHPAAPLYTASKYWLRGFAHTMESRLGTQGVSVSIIHPSETRTEWQGSEDETPAKEQYSDGDALEPRDIAESVVFAVTRESPVNVSRMDVYRQDKLGDFIG